jgi:cytochrome c-type biogenesis protein CcmH/NrfG
MPRESIVFAVSGAFFGLLVGWIIGSQQGSGAPPAMMPAAQMQGSQASAAATPAPRPVDSDRVRALEASAAAAPADPGPRVELGHLYLEADHFGEAIRWYEEALRLDPKNVSASTDLGVAYYYTSQPDRALAQFERSLAIDPSHTRTLLHVGVVRAFGKEDLKGATEAWERVVHLAPDSDDGRAARRALDAVRNAHPEAGGAASPQSRGSE